MDHPNEIDDAFEAIGSNLVMINDVLLKECEENLARLKKSISRLHQAAGEAWQGLSLLEKRASEQA